MLTKSDLKAIKTVVGEDIKRDLKENIKQQLKPIKEDIISQLNENIKQQFKPVKEDISKIRKDIKVIVDFFDQEYLNLRKRVERIEEHLNLSPLQ